jgi:hypothetical protein
MNNKEILDLAESFGWVDDFDRWNFQGDEQLLEFVHSLLDQIDQRWAEVRS